jgi:hypothetical protein
MNFEVKSKRPGGLWIGLSSERSATSPNNSVWVTEDAFGFLEPSIAKFCTEYKEFSHWGLTQINRQDCLAILEDWRQLIIELEHVENSLQYTRIVWLNSDDAKRDFRNDFSGVRSRLAGLVKDLDVWIRHALADSECIFMHGI